LRGRRRDVVVVHSPSSPRRPLELHDPEDVALREGPIGETGGAALRPNDVIREPAVTPAELDHVRVELTLRRVAAGTGHGLHDIAQTR
jgi:hypothetical protein